MATLLDDPTETLHLEVDFYDDHEKERLLRYPTANQIRELVKSGARVKTAQFLTYYMFHKRRPGKSSRRQKRNRNCGPVHDANAGRRTWRSRWRSWWCDHVRIAFGD